MRSPPGSAGARSTPHAAVNLSFPRDSYADSGICADRPERAQRAWALGVLRSKSEVPRDDARSGCSDTSLDGSIVRSDLDQIGAADVEKHQARIQPARQQPSASRQSVQPQLHRVSLDKPCVQGGIGLVVDEGRAAVDLTDPVDKPAHPSTAEPQVELELDTERLRLGKRVGQVAR